MTANRSMALRLVWATRLDDHTPAPDARELLAMCGLIQPDGREVLPDDVRQYTLGDVGTAPGGKDSNPASPLAFADHGRRPHGMTSPPGLAVLPPPAPVPVKPPPPPRVLAPCGTYSAYLRHKRNRLPVDDLCADAARAHWRANNARRARKDAS